MLHLNIKKILKLRGISKPIPFLINAGLSNNQAYRLLNFNRRSLPFNLIYKICLALDCTPNDILELHSSAQSQLPQKHQLLTLLPKPELNFNEIAKDIPPNKIPDLINLLDNFKSSV